MKKENFKRKLSLNKQVVSKLGRNEMINIKGGRMVSYFNYVKTMNSFECDPTGDGTGYCHCPTNPN